MRLRKTHPMSTKGDLQRVLFGCLVRSFAEFVEITWVHDCCVLGPTVLSIAQASGRHLVVGGIGASSNRPGSLLLDPPPLEIASRQLQSSTPTYSIPSLQSGMLWFACRSWGHLSATVTKLRALPVTPSMIGIGAGDPRRIGWSPRGVSSSRTRCRYPRPWCRDDSEIR